MELWGFTCSERWFCWEPEPLETNSCLVLDPYPKKTHKKSDLFLLYNILI